MTRFLHSETREPIQEGVLYCAYGVDWEVYIVRESSAELFTTVTGANGREVMPMATKLAEKLGLKAYTPTDVVKVLIPDPVICLGCGRSLIRGKCPYLEAYAKDFHDVEELDDWPRRWKIAMESLAKLQEVPKE